MNAKGTSQSSFRIGKRGSRLYGTSDAPSDVDNISTGDLWFDSSNTLIKIATVSDGSVAWSKLTVGDADTLDGINSTSFARVDTDNTFANDVTITGNLIVNGTQSIINTETLNIADNEIVLNSDLPSNQPATANAGILVNRGNESNVYLRWDEDEGEWTVNGQTFSAGAFVGNLSGNVTGSIAPNGAPNVVRANTLIVNGSYTMPTSDGTAGQFLQTDGSGGITFSSEFTDLSITGTATYNTVEFQNSNIMKFNQRYTGASNGSYFSNGEYQKVVTIIPSGASQNYQVVGRMTAQNAGETHTVYFNAALRSNTLPDLDWTITYDEEYNGGRYLDPQLWTKETTTAGFIFAFKTLGTIYGSVTIDMEVIPRASSQKDNVTVNTVVNSEQSSVDAGYTANDMVLVTRKQGTTFSVKDVSITGNIVPTANEVYDLGTSSNRFKDLYLSGSTINLGTTAISINSNDEVDFTDSANSSIKRKLVVDEIHLGDGDDAVVLKKGSDGRFQSKTQNRSSKAESTNKVDLDDNNSDDLSEGSTNLYFTNARADARVTSVLATQDSDDIKEGSTNLYFTDARANSAIDAKLTGNLTFGEVDASIVSSPIFETVSDYGLITSSTTNTIDYGLLTDTVVALVNSDYGVVETSGGPVEFPRYAVLSVPDASAYIGHMIYVTNDTGGPVMAFSDGTNWRRVTDRAVIS
jgi:hypothetical protein